MTELASRLIKLEDDLNNSNIIPIGSLLTNYYIQIYKGKKLPSAFSILKVAYQILKYCITVFNFRNSGKLSKLWVGKSGNKFHHNKLTDFILDTDDASCKVSPNYSEIFSALSFFNRLEVILQAINVFIKTIGTIKNIFYKNEVTISNLLFTTYFYSLVRYLACIKLFKSKKLPQLILVDYDRAHFSAIVCAGNTLGIQTVSLQHGVINPPYGFFPLIANKIWVWGDLWKNILVENGVNESSIDIVGSSIVDDEFRPFYKKKSIIVGIGPNPIGDENNRNVWLPVIEKLINMNIEVVIKLHPSMNKDNSLKIFGNRCLILNADEISNAEYFKSITILFVSNSGFGYEAVLNGVPVFVKMESLFSKANDYIMIKRGDFPDIDFVFNNNINFSSLNLEEIWKKEFEFVTNHVYRDRGQSSERAVKEATYKIIY